MNSNKQQTIVHKQPATAADAVRDLASLYAKSHQNFLRERNRANAEAARSRAAEDRARVLEQELKSLRTGSINNTAERTSGRGVAERKPHPLSSVPPGRAKHVSQEGPDRSHALPREGGRRPSGGGTVSTTFEKPPVRMEDIEISFRDTARALNISHADLDYISRYGSLKPHISGRQGRRFRIGDVWECKEHREQTEFMMAQSHFDRCRAAARAANISSGAGTDRSGHQDSFEPLGLDLF